MIWFFLMGMIAGAAGVIMMLRWWIKTHLERISADTAIREIEELKRQEEEKSDD